jgi:hypothetical protein
MTQTTTTQNEAPTPDKFAILREALRSEDNDRIKEAVLDLEAEGVTRDQIPADLQEHLEALLPEGGDEDETKGDDPIPAENQEANVTGTTKAEE